MPYYYPDSVLMVFCKAPIPGQVKTRLMPALTAAEACAVHIELSLRTLTLASQAHLCPVQLWCSPTTDHEFFKRAVTDFGVSLHQQQGNGLGERMHHAFCTSLKQYPQALLIGCDCVSLTEDDLAEALQCLQNTQVVLAPAEDGGYPLIGLQQPQPGMFTDMPWGTAEVLAKTRCRIQQLGLSHHELKQQWDVDCFADLTKYRLLNG